MKLKAIIALLAALALSAACTALVLAENGDAVESAAIDAEVSVNTDIAEEEIAVEEEAEEERVIERKAYGSHTPEFTVMFNDRLDGTEEVGDSVYFYRSVSDAVADYNADYYVPSGMNEDSVGIIYDARGVKREGPVVFQIHYYSDDFDMVWLYPGTGHFDFAPDSEIYVSNGNTFYISAFNDGNSDGFLAWGVIDGNTYQIHCSTAEKVKVIIVSFVKA